MISLHPAICAGVASIRTVEKRGAVPPGMYNPTFSVATAFCQQVTPGSVVIFFPWNTCAAWNVRMLIISQCDGRLQFDADFLFCFGNFFLAYQQGVQLHFVEFFFVFEYGFITLKFGAV